MNRGNVHLNAVHTMVLDEADEMLNMGFVKDVTVVGNDDRIELWAGEVWNEEQDKLDPASIAESLIEAGL